MKVKFAKTAGFCMGVRRAMELVLTEANRGGGPLFTFGPLIHNNQVMELLASKGVREIDEIAGSHEGRIVIRAHGIPPLQRQAIRKTGLKIVDATCPKVARVQAIIRYLTHKGYTAIIVGDEHHAEVRGLVGYSHSPTHVINDAERVSSLPPFEKVFVVAQTTQNEKNYRHVVTALRNRYPDIRVFNTICDATRLRQIEVKSFAGRVDAVVVVGGYHSGNTRRLCEVSKAAGIPTLHVETEKDLNKEMLRGMKTIGLTAGASTPNWMIKNVGREIETIRGRRESSFLRLLKDALRFLVLSNVAVAAGAFSFAYAVSVLSNSRPHLLYPLLTFFYIYAMYVFNRFLDKGASAYNDPERAAFLKKNKSLLITTGLGAISLALVFSFQVGFPTFLTLTGFSLLGIVYSIPVVPHRIRDKTPYSKIKDIPGSRTLSEALGWAAVIGVLPLLTAEKIVWPTAITCIFIVFLISYTRSALFDILQVQGDLVVGSETLPITLGEKKTLILLKFTILASAILLTAGPVFSLLDPFSIGMLIPLLTLSLCLFAYEKSWLYPGIRFEALVEANFFLAGFLALLYQVI